MCHEVKAYYSVVVIYFHFLNLFLHVFSHIPHSLVLSEADSYISGGYTANIINSSKSFFFQNGRGKQGRTLYGDVNYLLLSCGCNIIASPLHLILVSFNGIG